MTKRSQIRFSISSLLVLTSSCCAATAYASSLHQAESDTCKKAPCISSKPEDHGAEYVFDLTGQDLRNLLKPAATGKDHEDTAIAWGNRAARNKHDRKDPNDIHNGSDKDDFACPVNPGHQPTPTAVPAPAALWMFLSGAVGLGLGARRRDRR